MRRIWLAALLTVCAASCTATAAGSDTSRHGAGVRRRSSAGVSIAVPAGWHFRAYAEPTDETNPKIPFAMATWRFPDRAIDRGPIPRGKVLIDLEEWAPPYAPGFPRPTARRFPRRPARFVLPAKPNSILPFASGKSRCYLLSFREAGRFFGVRVSVSRPLSAAGRRAVERILAGIRVSRRRT